MTLATCRKRLELAKEGKDPMGVEFWEKKIANKMKYPKYANEVVEEKSSPKPKAEVKEDGKKSKR